MYFHREVNAASELLKNATLKNHEALLKAYVHHLMKLKESDFPDASRDDYRKIVQAVTLPKGVEPIAGHSASSHAISSLSEREVSDVIAMIHKLKETLDSSESNG